MAGKKPNIDRIGISYMLRGEAGADVQDLNAKTPPEGKDWYYAGPHVMLVLPDSDKDALKDVGQDTSSGAPYVRGLVHSAHSWLSPWQNPTRRSS